MPISFAQYKATKHGLLVSSKIWQNQNAIVIVSEFILTAEEQENQGTRGVKQEVSRLSVTEAQFKLKGPGQTPSAKR